ncbi:MAG TPA: folylpolyglutamate synthase/dihydrofolate synthase family protein, partial [Lacipirellulaceae bacterium]|nr:folylpolyglutamate synthase/dihydrofolate synthase family protein [Lacipirellulaceae bacterium]
KIVHVAGTKGKGSTSAMIASILTTAGYRTGVFSSPHLERIEERFVVDGAPCSADELIALVNRVMPMVRAMDEEAAADGETAYDEAASAAGPTYFEITTAMALLHFVERQADAAVLEVGLGGRLDSTNVCLPVVSVITSISFDHMRQLGNTLGSIAREKAGIIKPGVPVICGVTDPEPQAVIGQTARDHGCRLIQLGRDFDFEYWRAGSSPTPSEDRQRNEETRKQEDSTTSLSFSPCLPVSLCGEITFDYTVPGQEYHLEHSPLAMPGRHQAANAAVALATISELRHQGWCISNDAISLGLSRAALPGRIEIFAGEATIVVDTAHNAASARALANTLAELPPAPRRTLILSVSHDKDVRAIVRELAPHFNRIVTTQYQDNLRAVAAEELLYIIRTEINYEAVDTFVRSTPRDAWQFVIDSSMPGERICIAGSFYLAAEMRPLVQAAVASEPLSR